MTTRNKKQGASLIGLKKDGTVKVGADIALELAVYAKAGYEQKSMVEQAVRDYIKKNPLPKKVRESCVVCVEHEYGVS